MCGRPCPLGERRRPRVRPARWRQVRAPQCGTPMPLTLLTGPANSAKARAVLGGVRASLERDPLLVVPTSADVERYRRELAEDGLVIGARVLTFDGLLGEIARRGAVAGRP